MITQTLYGSLSGCLLLLLLSPGRVWSNDAVSLTESSTGSRAATYVEDSIQPDVPVAAETGEVSTESVEHDWVADSLRWLTQAVAPQGAHLSSEVQERSPMPLLSSTSSEDLQPMEPLSVRENSFQASSAHFPEIAQAAPTQPQSVQWHFLLVPYVYLPFFISGSATYEGSEDFQNNFSGNFDGSRDFEFIPTQIRTSLRNSLNFAFLGEIEAWTPNYTLGVLANFDYLSLTGKDTIDRSVRRPGFANFVPTEINASLNTQIWTVDLAGSYRFYDQTKVNPQGLDTEFDLGPFVFDAVGGLSVASVNTQLGLTTNLGGDGEFTTSNTVVSPLLGGRFRWNATPTLAVLVSGTVSGFGIGGLTQYGVLGGVDWMFSGNTTLGLGYRAGFLDYNSGSSEVDLNVDQHGPYLNFGFRF